MKSAQACTDFPNLEYYHTQKLFKHLANDGYISTGHTPGLFCHITCPTDFKLVVDNFGVKVVRQIHCNHLINILKKNYDVTIYRGGKHFCGIH